MKKTLCILALATRLAFAQTPADQSVLKLNTDMMTLYNAALKEAQSDLLRNHSVILASFTGQGGTMTLYRPGQAPLVAERVPIRYELMKSVAHSSMAIFAHLWANLGESSGWQAPLQSYRATSEGALKALESTEIPPEWRETVKATVTRNIQFMDKALQAGSYTKEDLRAYATELKPLLKDLIAWAAETQVGHWMGVVEGWKKSLGPDWEKTLGATNTLYVTRQNNILFTVLAQYFGKEALNSRLFLFETAEFTTTPEQMLSLLARIVADRSVGLAFFNDYYLMDYELMGGDARRVIEAEDKRRGIPVNLPGLVPFHSSEWPMRHDATQGTGPARLEDVR